VRRGAIELVGGTPDVNQVWLWRNVLVVSWLGKPTPESANRLGPMVEELLPRIAAEKLSFIHLVPNNLPLPEADTRQALLDLSRAYTQLTACVAVIIAGGGFWASAIRDFVTGIRVLAPRDFDVRMYKSVSELLGWFPDEHARKTSVLLDPGELAEQLERVLIG
jgi:hypothetical protein